MRSNASIEMPAWLLATAVPGLPMLGLLLVSIVAGAAMLWVFGKCSNQGAIRATKNRIKAHLLELRLFSDEPALVFRAQGRLLLENLRLIAYVLPPIAVLALPMLVLFVYADAFLGRAPLPVGRPAIVTVRLNDLRESTPAPQIEPPAGIAVESPAVRIIETGEVSWRIRASAPASGTLRIVTPSGALGKHIEAGPNRFTYLADHRGASWSSLLLRAGEMPFSDPAVQSIELRYPTAYLGWFGLELHWLIWFFIFSMAAALLLKKRMGVAF